MPRTLDSDELTLIKCNPDAEDCGCRLIMRNGWAQIEKACNDLARGIRDYGSECDVVLAISPDLIPATLIASALNVPLVPIIYGSLLGQSYSTSALPRINNQITSGSGQMPEIPSLLLITSMLDGETHVNDVVKKYKQRGHDVQLVTLFQYKGIKEITTRLYWQHIMGGQKSVKLVFPW